MTPAMRRALLGKETSRRNKFALIAQYRLEGEVIEWQWEGEPFNSRLWVSFRGDYHRCKSFDEDVHAQLKDNRPGKP